MKTPSAFTAAFWAGLAAPTAIYDPPAPYLAYVRPFSVGQSFSAVGRQMQTAQNGLECDTDVGRS